MDAGSGQPERIVLESIIDFHFSFFVSEENLALIVLGLTERQDIGERNLTMVRDGLVPYISRIADLIERGMDEGVFRMGNPVLTATALFGLMQMTIFHKILAGVTYSFDEARAEVKRIFFTGIQV